MKILDLFCCCGGMSKGFAEADHHEITGVDITDDHQYPFNFIHSDVFDLSLDFLQQFDFIHASPPCQQYSFATKGIRNKGKKYPDLVAKTRQLLLKIDKPFIIENVIGAPVRKDIMLCGQMFGLRVLRHRIFETHGFTVLQPPHERHRPAFCKGYSYYATIAGHGGEGFSYRLEEWQKAIGIDWITNKKHLTQAIPPAYAEYISRFI